MDAEKVKKGLEHCTLGRMEISTCSKCPYAAKDGCARELMSDALELIAQLEERVAIATECKHGRWVDREGKTWCSHCGASNKQYKPPFCPHCGYIMDEEVQEDGNE